MEKRTKFQEIISNRMDITEFPNEHCLKRKEEKPEDLQESSLWVAGRLHNINQSRQSKYKVVNNLTLNRATCLCICILFFQKPKAFDYMQPYKHILVKQLIPHHCHPTVVAKWSKKIMIKNKNMINKYKLKHRKYL